MPDDLSKNPGMQSLLEKQRQIELLLEQASGESEPGRIAALAEILTGEANELEAMAKAFQESQGAKDGLAGMVEVVLTPEQRARIEEKSGVAMETVRIPDETGTMSKIMPTTRPEIIEMYALRQARERRQAAEAQFQIQGELASAFAVLEGVVAGVDSPEAAAAFAQMRENVEKSAK